MEFIDRRKILIWIGIGIAVLLVIIGAIFLFKGKTTENAKEVTLTWWDVQYTQEEVKPLIESYQSQNPNIKVNYTQKDSKTYEEDLLNAIAEGNSPDIFTIRNDWLPKHVKKLAPLPESVISQKDYETQFLPFVKSELTYDDKLYGFAFTVDPSALYYNKKITEEAYPQTWNEFKNIAVSKTQKSGNYISQSGAIFGTSQNTEHSFEILSLLMIQNSSDFLSADSKKAIFNLAKQGSNGPYFPGTNALNFYTSFGKPSSSNYSWNEGIKDPLQWFIDGKAGLMIETVDKISEIEKRNPSLKFGTVPLPQLKLGDEIYYCSFWAKCVGQNSKNQAESWQFLNYATSANNLSSFYGNLKTRYVSSRNDLIKNNRDSKTEPFINTALKTPKTWERPVDYKKFEEIFAIMINNVTSGGLTPQQAIDSAAKELTKFLEQSAQ